MNPTFASTLLSSDASAMLRIENEDEDGERALTVDCL
jgi:hypothetical protein